MAGERCDIPTFNWLQSKFPGLLINDNYWQTETGWPMCSNYLGLERFKTKPGSACKPVPGYNLAILDHNGNDVPVHTLGKVCFKYPTPPSFVMTLWNQDDQFQAKYFSNPKGCYSTGDVGYKDEDGYFHM